MESASRSRSAGRSRSASLSGVVPLRPLTVGELLDAAVGLLRAHARPLLAVAFGLAAVEQAVLFPLRMAAGVHPPTYFPPYSDRLAEYWIMIGTGYATEAAVIAALGGLAARAAAGTVLGRPVAGRALLRPNGTSVPAVALVAATVGILAGLAALAGGIPWIFAYGLLGLAVPAVVVDGRGPVGAIGRSLVLSSRGGLRACWVRLIGYLGWIAIRSALGFGGMTALGLVLPATRWWVSGIGVATWLLVNTVAYATLACLDAVLHLETRMRTEGLDIALILQQRRGRPVSLAVPR